MKQKLVIVGDSSFGEIAQEYFTHDSPYEVAGFAVEASYRKRDRCNGLPVVDLEQVTEHFPPAEHDAFVALTYAQLNRVRARLCAQMKAQGYALARYISSRAFVWHNVSIGENVFIFEDNTVQPFVTIGNDVILWSGNHIGHHSTIGDHCFISSHVVVSGHCDLKPYSFIGVNATIGNNITVAEDNFLAQGAVVFKDTEADRLYQGNPAEPRAISARKFFKVQV